MAPCDSCTEIKYFSTSGLKVILNRTENFKKENIKCYRIQIFKNNLLLTCYSVQPDSISPKALIPPGKYDVIASADSYTKEMRDILIGENKTVYIGFEFDMAETKKKSKRKK